MLIKGRSNKYLTVNVYNVPSDMNNVYKFEDA